MIEKIIGNTSVKIDNFEFLCECFKGRKRKIEHSEVARVFDFVDMDLIKECIDCYYRVLDKLVFPLNYFEGDIKYNTIALCMKHIAKEEEMEKLINHLDSSDTYININNGLTISVDSYTALEFIGSSWRMIDIQYGINSNISEMVDYESRIGYSEYLWSIQKIYSNQSLEGYYLTFMKELYNACDDNIEKVIKELEYILKIESYGRVMECNDYQFIDLDNKIIHQMVIKSLGKTQINQERLTLRIGIGGNIEDSEYRKIYKNTYDYELSSLDFQGNSNESNSINGLDTLMRMVIGRHSEDIYRAKFKGYIKGRYIIFEFDNDIYYCSRDDEDVKIT